MAENLRSSVCAAQGVNPDQQKSRSYVSSADGMSDEFSPWFCPSLMTVAMLCTTWDTHKCDC